MATSGSGQLHPSSAGSVRIFEADPDLALRLPEWQRRQLQRRVVVPTLRLTPGEQFAVDSVGGLGLVILSGHLLSEVALFGRRGVELIGPGDVIGGRDSYPTSSIPRRGSLTALTRLEAGILDGEFAAIAASVPSLASCLVTRTAERAERLARQVAISQISGLAARMVVLFWHLAEKWGRREEGRTVLPLPLRHGLLADLACAQRESVSRALSALRQKGIIDRGQNGYWSLRGLPPQTADELLLIQGQASDALLRKSA